MRTAKILISIFSIMILRQFMANPAIGNNIDSLAAKLQLPNWIDRQGVAEKIINTPNLDTSMAINIIIDVIKSEVARPTSSQYIHGSYATNSERLMVQYLSALTKLGQSAIPKLRLVMNSADGDLKKWSIIALGRLKDDSVHNELKNMARVDTSQFIRSHAIFSLSFYADSTDIPIFGQALSDTSIVIVHTDVFLEDGQPLDSVVRPVRETAIRALLKMGYKVALDAEGNPYLK